MPGLMILMLLQAAGSAPVPATDYVVHSEIVPRFGASSGGRHVTYRSGDRVRIDWTLYGRGTGTTYQDRAQGVTVTAVRDRDGSPFSLGIQRAPGLSSRVLRQATRRHDSAIGEPCTIWRVSAQNRESGREVCETADGIQLWSALWYPPRDDTVMDERATAIERRPVRPEEVLPPRDLLALASLPPPATPVADPGTDYEVEMVGAGETDGSLVFRRHGRFSSRERRESRGRWLHINNGAVSIHYSESDASGPLSIEISRIGSQAIVPIASRWEPIAGRRPERVLGETCTWQHDAAIQSTFLDNQCRTVDGIPLKMELGGHWGPVQHFTARGLSRRPLAAADFAPPARALDLANWGITPAP